MHRTTVFGQAENALADAATALAILTEITGPAAGEDPAEWARLLARSLNGLVVVLLGLGSHELADEVSQRAIAVAESGCSGMDRLVHQLNRVRLRATEAVAALPADVAGGVTMSVGVIHAPLDGEAAVVLAAADAAMYRAKHAGGNTVVSGPTPPGTAAPSAGRAGSGRTVDEPASTTTPAGPTLAASCPP